MQQRKTRQWHAIRKSNPIPKPQNEGDGEKEQSDTSFAAIFSISSDFTFFALRDFYK